VLTSVYLDEQPRFEAREVDDILADRNLLAKAMAFYLPASKKIPQSTLGICHLLAKTTCIPFQHRICGTPLPNLPPQGGKGFF
jgi:hypothetical protein